MVPPEVGNNVEREETVSQVQTTLRLRDEERRLMHLVPAPAVRLSIPWVPTLCPSPSAYFYYNLYFPLKIAGLMEDLFLWEDSELEAERLVALFFH